MKIPALYCKRYKLSESTVNQLVNDGIISKRVIRSFEVYECFVKNLKKYPTNQAVKVTSKMVNISERGVYRAIKACKITSEIH